MHRLAIVALMALAFVGRAEAQDDKYTRAATLEETKDLQIRNISYTFTVQKPGSKKPVSYQIVVQHATGKNPLTEYSVATSIEDDGTGKPGAYTNRYLAPEEIARLTSAVRTAMSTPLDAKSTVDPALAAGRTSDHLEADWLGHTKSELYRTPLGDEKFMPGPITNLLTVLALTGKLPPPPAGEPSAVAHSTDEGPRFGFAQVLDDACMVVPAELKPGTSGFAALPPSSQAQIVNQLNAAAGKQLYNPAKYAGSDYLTPTDPAMKNLPHSVQNQVIDRVNAQMKAEAEKQLAAVPPGGALPLAPAFFMKYPDDPPAKKPLGALGGDD